MRDQVHALFNPKTIDRLCEYVQVTDQQGRGVSKWLALLKTGALDKEQRNYFKFAIIVLKDILGYNIEEDLNFEEGNVEFSFVHPITKKSVCIEVKGTSTKDLFSNQNREKPEHQTPIRQTWDYMGSGNFDYGIATNYRDFVLIDKTKGYSRYHLFDFVSIQGNLTRMKEFLAIFSYDSLLGTGILEKLYEESVVEDREFTKEFYKLYHETRLMMIKEFQENNQITKQEAIHYAQLFLNRLIFIFFAEDTGKIRKRLFSESILESLKLPMVSKFSRYSSDTIVNLFEQLDKGSQTPIEIFGFNGGLFREKIDSRIFFNDLREGSYFSDVMQYSTLKKNFTLDEFAQKVVEKFKKTLNPIVKNLLIMSSFDFESDLNVNILGHIFEQSLTDLEELQAAEKTSKRKKEAIYYTPQYVTEYICRNTIIPYLSKSGTTRVEELIGEYSDNIEKLESKFKNLKILDPACGSGAFLLGAVDILLDIYREIQIFKESHGKYIVTKKSKKRRNAVAEFYTLKRWNEQEEARKIIENNIFGVDKNEESVEITKLSLFLRIATTNRKLIDLSSNIKMGNSIILDNTIAEGKAFNWEKEFNRIDGRFDIVTGNPPYIPLEDMTDAEAAYYAKNFKGIFRKYDTSVLFVEKAFGLLKDGGLLGFIMPLTWQTGDNYFKFRKMLFIDDKITLRNLINLPFDVFPDAYVDTGIAIFRKKNEDTPFLAFQYEKDEKINSIEPKGLEAIEKKQILEESDLKVFPNNSTYEILKKVKKGSIELGPSLTDSCQGIVTSKFPVSKAKVSDKYQPFLLEADSNRYRFSVKSSAFIDFSKASTIVHLYTQPKIMIRRIVNRQNRLMAFYEDSGIITNKDYNPFIIQPEYKDKFDIFYLLALLNSKLFSFLYIKKSSLALKDDFRQTTLAEIRKLPIKDILKEEQVKIAEKARLLTDLYKKYYDLKDRLLRRIEENFKVKTSKKLMEVTDLSFSEVRAEIESLSGRKIGLEEQDEWDHYFNKNTDQLKSLRNEITIVESQIDNEVYDLYGISQEERNLIDQSLKEKNI